MKTRFRRVLAAVAISGAAVTAPLPSAAVAAPSLALEDAGSCAVTGTGDVISGYIPFLATSWGRGYTTCDSYNTRVFNAIQVTPVGAGLSLPGVDQHITAGSTASTYTSDAQFVGLIGCFVFTIEGGATQDVTLSPETSAVVCN